MTAQRLVRGSKARIIAGLCTLAFCVAFLVLFQKTQTELDNVKQNYENCVQQQESLATQLQVIVDYKTRLEKSLQVEKSEHTQTRTELESKINDEKTRRDRTSMEANIRFQSLQQHYKLLQTKHEDLKEKSDKLQQQYLDDVDKLQSKIKEQQEQLKQSEKNKEKSLEHLKTLYMQLQVDKENLAEQLKTSKVDRAKWDSDLNHLTKINHQLLRELETYKNKNPRLHNEEVLVEPLQQNPEKIPTTNRNISKLVKVKKDVYQIQDKNNKPVENNIESNVLQINPPNKEENLVLQRPSQFKSSTKANSVSKGNLNDARPLLLPTMTPSNKNNSKNEKPNDINSANVLPMPNLNFPKKLPPGVVPVPKLEKNDQNSAKIEDKNAIPEEINLALPNRYRNNIIESELANVNNKEIKPEVKSPHLQNEPEVALDNAALEVMDQAKNPAQEDPLHLMDENDPEHVIKDPVAQLLNKNLKKQHIDALKAGNGENAALRAPPGGALYENEGDYDKEGQKEDLQIEEAEPEGEEDDDVDEYNEHLAARRKDPAVRN